MCVFSEQETKCPGTKDNNETNKIWDTANDTHFRLSQTCGKRSSCSIVRGCDVIDGSGDGDGADDSDFVIGNDDDDDDDDDDEPRSASPTSPPWTSADLTSGSVILARFSITFIAVVRTSRPSPSRSLVPRGEQKTWTDAVRRGR